MRRGFDDGVKEGRGRTGRVDEADRQAARGHVGDTRRERLDALGQIEQGHLGMLARALAGIDDQRVLAVFGERRAEAFEHDAAERDVRVRDDRHQTHPRMREEAAQAIGLVERHRS
jgi:hypothetical protein